MRRAYRDDSLETIRILCSQECHDQSTHRMADHHGLVNRKFIHHRNHILSNGSDGYGLAGVFRTARSIRIDGDAAVLRSQVGDNREVEVLRRAQAMNKDKSQALFRCALRVRVGIVQLVVVHFDLRHVG